MAKIPTPTCPNCGNDNRLMQEMVEETYEYRVYFCNGCARKYAKRIVKVSE